MCVCVCVCGRGGGGVDIITFPCGRSIISVEFSGRQCSVLAVAGVERQSSVSRFPFESVIVCSVAGVLKAVKLCVLWPVFL